MLPDRIELSTSPLPMECSTTELRQHARYVRGIGPNGRPPSGRFLPQGPLWRKHAGRSGRTQNGQKSARAAGEQVQSGQPGPDPVPVGPEPPNHDLNCFTARAWTLTGIGNLPKQAIATRRGESHYVPAWRRGVAANPASIQILFRSKSRFDQGSSDGLPMKGDQGKGAEKTGADVKDSRRDRLKLALRENLKRRKSQARGRSDVDAASSENADASLDDASGAKPGQ